MGLFELCVRSAKSDLRPISPRLFACERPKGSLCTLYDLLTFSSLPSISFSPLLHSFISPHPYLQILHNLPLSFLTFSSYSSVELTVTHPIRSVDQLIYGSTQWTEGLVLPSVALSIAPIAVRPYNPLQAAVFGVTLPHNRYPPSFLIRGPGTTVKGLRTPSRSDKAPLLFFEVVRRITVLLTTSSKF